MADNTNTGKQGGAPMLPNSFDDGRKPADASAPAGVANPVPSNVQGKQGR